MNNEEITNFLETERKKSIESRRKQVIDVANEEPEKKIKNIIITGPTQMGKTKYRKIVIYGEDRFKMFGDVLKIIG